MQGLAEPLGELIAATRQAREELYERVTSCALLRNSVMLRAAWIIS